ncbi:MAG: hypothetical protein HY360_18410, partial [Verrucomicrobia bacterium]|nr:hypothetical protein [Verrucomicrobiota bacterium]
VDIVTDKPIFSSYKLYATCLNNDDFWSSYMRRLEELFKGVPMDGVMVDEIEFWGDYTCGCRFCRDKFKQATGHEIPYGRDKTFFGNLGNPACRAWLKWRTKMIQERNLEIRALMEKYMSAGGFYPAYNCNLTACGSYGAAGFGFGGIETLLAYSNAIGLESEPINFKYYYEWPVVLADMKYLKAVAGKLEADPWVYSYPSEYGDYVCVSFLAMCMGAAQWCGGEHNPDEFVTQARKPILQWAAKYQDLLGNTRPFANTGVLFSTNTRLMSREGEDHTRGYVGTCQALADAHVSYKVVLDQDLPSGGLQDLQTLVMFNTACVRADALDGIERFVRDGGTLIASGNVALTDEHGQARSNFDLGPLLGCAFDKVVACKPNRLVIGADNGALPGLAGEYPHDEPFIAVKDLGADCAVLGEMVAADGARYPGLVLRRVGAGKVLYFTGHPELKYLSQAHIQGYRLQIGKTWKDRRDPDFLRIIKAALSYGNPAPLVKVDNLPRGVVAEAYEQTNGKLKGIAVHLVNFIGADLKEGIVPRLLEIGFPDLKKHLPAPEKEIEIAVKAASVRKVFLVSPDFSDTVELKCRRDGDYAAVRLPTFYRYGIVYFAQEGEEVIQNLTGGKTIKKLPSPVALVTRNEPAWMGSYDPGHLVFLADHPANEGGLYSPRAMGGMARVLYGAASQYPSMRVKWNLPDGAQKVKLEIGAMEYALKDKAPIEIKLNGKVICKGNSPFPSRKMGTASFDVDPKDLKPTDNILEIRNTAEGGGIYRPPWIMVGFVKIIPVTP